MIYSKSHLPEFIKDRDSLIELVDCITEAEINFEELPVIEQSIQILDFIIMTISKPDAV